MPYPPTLRLCAVISFIFRYFEYCFFLRPLLLFFPAPQLTASQHKRAGEASTGASGPVPSSPAAPRWVSSCTICVRTARSPQTPRFEFFVQRFTALHTLLHRPTTPPWVLRLHASVRRSLVPLPVPAAAHAADATRAAAARAPGTTALCLRAVRREQNSRKKEPKKIFDEAGPSISSRVHGWATSRRKLRAAWTARSVERFMFCSVRNCWIHAGSFVRLSARVYRCGNRSAKQSTRMRHKK